MNTYKINTTEAIMIVLTSIIIHTILSLPRNLLTQTKSATIINLIYVSVIAIAISYFIYRLLKNFPGLDIIDISELLGGKVLKNILGIIFILFFLVSSGMFLRNFCEILKVIYYPMTNITFIILIFILAVCIANNFNFNTTIKTNALILPLVLASIIFLFLANIKNFTPQRIFPIFGDGLFNTFGLGLINISSFSGIVFLYFIPPLLRDPKHMKNVSLISIGISAIYLILCVSALLFMFSFYIDTNEITPLYNAARYIEFGKFFQRLESVFLLFWILAFACYVSIILKFSMRIFQKLTNIETKKPLVNLFGLLLFGITLIPKDYSVSENYEMNIYKYLVLGFTFAFSMGILILANLNKKKRKDHYNA